MSIDNYLSNKEIKLSELRDHFVEVDRSDPYNADTSCCPACGDKHNISKPHSEPWTFAIVCHKCGSISMIIFGDKMGGGFDTILTFKEKR